MTSGTVLQSRIQIALLAAGRFAITNVGRSQRLKGKLGTPGKRKSTLLLPSAATLSLICTLPVCRRVLAATTAMCGDGPYFANGGTFVGSKQAGDHTYNVSSNLEGDWGNTQTLHSGDPRNLISSVNVSHRRIIQPHRTTRCCS